MSWNITDIENISYQEAEKMSIEKMMIKDHEILFVDFGGYFGYSVLVWKNGKHIYYANDYELHHPSQAEKKESLREYYIEEMTDKLFTDDEMMQESTTYKEYDLKQYFLRNYYIKRFDYLSMFCIEKQEQAHLQKLKKEYPFTNTISFCYVKDAQIIETQQKFLDILEQSYKKMLKDKKTFREMISKELANHEACITCDYTDALDSLGLHFANLTLAQQSIVHEELKKQIDNYCWV